MLQLLKKKFDKKSNTLFFIKDMLVRLRRKRRKLNLAGIIKSEYKVYFMAFLKIFFFSVTISLIFDHEPTKH
jgi:hypothetical protein